MGTHVAKDNAKELPVPPGFVSLTAFTVKRLTNGERGCISSTFENESAQVDTASIMMDSTVLKKHLRNRPWILQNQVNNIIDKPVPEQLYMGDDSLLVTRQLPKGVTRGCSRCNNCQKVTANWRPQEALIPVLEEAPAFYPTEEEFKDTLKYIASLRSQTERYGICRVIPPRSWQPPCLIKENDKVWERSRFSTYIQRIHELQNLYSKKKLNQIKLGGDQNETGCYFEGFEFERGPEFTLNTFKKHADYFEGHYCLSSSSKKESEPSVKNIEGEYWRIIENPSEEIEVLYGAGLEIRGLCSGFPSVSGSYLPEYVESGWNLSNTPKLQGSLLAFESNKMSSVTLPRLNVGMCFSSHCWKTEEHHLYSLCYLHLGAPRIWYCIPGEYFSKFESFLKKKYPELSQHSVLLHKLVTQFSPSTLKAEGIPVYRCVQYPREFVVTLPRVYSSGLDCGFNCSELVNFAPYHWLPHGQNAAELYSEQHRKTSLSFDKLLLQAAMEAVKAQWKLSISKETLSHSLLWTDVCGKDGILTKALKLRIKQEIARREYLCTYSQSKEMENDFDFSMKRECTTCLYDLHFSAVGCPCSPNKFSCLKHAKQLCLCPWSSRIFLLRYKTNDLNVLIEALEGNSKAISTWAKENLGLPSDLLSKDPHTSEEVKENKSDVLDANQLASQRNLKEKYVSSSRDGIDIPVKVKPQKPDVLDASHLASEKKMKENSASASSDDIVVDDILVEVKKRKSDASRSSSEKKMKENSASSDDIIIVSDDE